MLLNLRVNSTQRNKSYHIIIKQKLNKNLSVSTTCEAIVTKTKLLAKEYNKQINNNQKNNPTLIDLKAFVKARSKLTLLLIRLWLSGELLRTLVTLLTVVAKILSSLIK
jgi:hypothetical protein